MYLIDTSVWIDFFRNKQNKAVKQFLEIIDNDIRFGITPLIYQEVLQGVKSTQDMKKLREYLNTQIIYYPKHDLKSYESAAQLYFNCRVNGITIRSTIDCLIAQTAIEYNLILLHSDKDFTRLATYATELRQDCRIS